MRTIWTILNTLLYLTAYCQDTTYFDIDDRIVYANDVWHYRGITELDELDTNKVVVKTFFRTGQVRSEVHFGDYQEKIRHGLRRE